MKRSEWKLSGTKQLKADRTEVFRDYSVPKAVFTLAIPTVLNQLVTTIYNLVDTFFVGQTGDANMVAAVSLGSAAMMLLTAMGNLLGMGGGSLISRCLGAQQPDRAKKTSSFCALTSLALGIIFMFVIILFLEPFSRLIGASDNTVEYTKSYLFWTMGIGAVPTIFALVLGNQIRAEGNAKHEMIGMVMGHLVNIVLDPILIFPCGLGVAGAAIATMVSSLLACIYYLIFIYKTRDSSVLNMKPANYVVDVKIIKDVLMVGLPASLNSVLNSVSRIVLNNVLSGFGDNAVAAMGIVRKIDEMPMFMASGFTNGVVPLIGYNYAAKNYDRMEKSYKFSLKMTILIASVTMVVLEIFAPVFIKLFIRDNAVIDMGTKFLRIQSLCLPIMTSNFAVRSKFQAIGKGPKALIVAVCRQGIIFVPVVLIMGAFVGIYGVASTQLIADGLSLGIAILLNRSVKKEIAAVEAAAAMESVQES